MEITAAQSSRIEPLLPVQRGNVSVSNCRVVNAILYGAEHCTSCTLIPAGSAGKCSAVLLTRHTEAIVFDREEVFIGSFNLDSRSGDINTEVGLSVESPELAAQVIECMDEVVRPRSDYRVLQGDTDLMAILVKYQTEAQNADARLIERRVVTGNRNRYYLREDLRVTLKRRS